MVHLASIPSHPRKKGESSSGATHQKARLQLAEYADEFTTTVYGSKFARNDLPRHEMPDGQMPREVAYRMIKDELSLDNNPMLKYALSIHLSVSAHLRQL
jgi:glutamate decarboxylase